MAAGLIPLIMLDAAKSRFRIPDRVGVGLIIPRILAGHGSCSSAAAAAFYAAVADYRNEGDASHLEAAHHRIANDYPGSACGERTSPYTRL